MSIYLIVLLAVIAVWAFTRFYLRGESLAPHSHIPGSYETFKSEPSPGHFEVLGVIENLIEQANQAGSAKKRLAIMRINMDALGEKVSLADLRIIPADIAGVPGEWVLAEGADPDRRFLYLHGGAYTMGSPMSHRVITRKMSEISGASVLAVDYRLMPENRRLDGLADCQTAYQWILDNGPDGSGPLQSLFVAGDSAGGNLSLVVMAWARDQGLRPADAVVALAPATDGTLTSPTFKTNVESDHLLGPSFGHMAKIPNGIMLWFTWLTSKVRPCDPRVSPAHGDLSNLPPTLVHASEDEMLLDDARRYVNKAKKEGSDMTLETWHHMVHVWQAFGNGLPEADASFDRIGAFLEKHAPRKVEPDYCHNGPRYQLP